MSSSISIGDRVIGPNAPPFVIAELSGNHNKSLDRALAIVEAAARAGAHAIKLQTYTADTITLDVHTPEFTINNADSLWRGRNLYELYREAHTPWEWHAPIMQRAKTLGMMCFSSPFDESAVDFLENLHVPAYKIASFENNHLPLIRKAAATRKPLIISTGMATLAELAEAVDTARAAGCRELVLLKCTSTYPASPQNTNVLTIPHMRKLFRCEVGLSDHTMGIGVAVAAVAQGASVVEKHFTLRRADGGVDSAFSLEPEELTALVVESERAWQSLGAVTYGPTQAEGGSRVFRRSLYVAEDMVAGEAFTPRNLRVVRPSGGLHPRYYERLLGRRVARAVLKGTAVDWSLLG
jgi:pseudaminic acid synthase